MDPGPILFTEIQSTAILFYCFLQTIIFHTIRLILCYSKPVRLTTSLFRWGKVLWLCCAGSTLAPESLVLRRTTSRRHQPSTCFLAPTGSIKPWFHTEGKLAAVRITPSSWSSQRTRAVRVSSTFSGAVAGEIKTRCKGSLPHPISLLCFCLALLYFIYCFVCSLYRKYKKISC